MKVLIGLLLAIATVAVTVFAVSEVANAKPHHGKAPVSAKCPRCP